MATKLHFTADVLEEQMYADFGNLNKFDIEAFKELSIIVFTFLTDPKQSAHFINQLEQFAASQSLGVNALKNVVKSYLIFLKAAMKRTLSPSHVKEDLEQLGLSEDRATGVSRLWKANLAGIARSAVSQTIMVNQLVDMEWRFGVTASSSEMQKVGSSFLQLKLLLNKGNKTEDVFMELTLPQFYSFLHEMEKAKASLDFLT